MKRKKRTLWQWCIGTLAVVLLLTGCGEKQAEEEVQPQKQVSGAQGAVQESAAGINFGAGSSEPDDAASSSSDTTYFGQWSLISRRLATSRSDSSGNLRYT